MLLRNKGDGTFNQITNSVLSVDGSHAVLATWGDYNNDGNLDLFLANGDGVSNSLCRNSGDGTFTFACGVISQEGGHSVVGAWADYDNDGNLDLFVVNKGEQNFLLGLCS